MKCIPSSDDGIHEAVTILKHGGVVAHATETCYGLACDLSNLEAVEKLFAIKQRPNDMPVSALFSSLEQAQDYLTWNDIADQLAREHLPGPLTLILRQRLDAPRTLFATATPEFDQTVGLRFSPHKTAQQLVKQYGFPLSTTSANIHGKPNPYSVADVQEQYMGASMQPDLIIDDGILEMRDASTVIDVSSGEIHVLRKGNIKL